MDNRECKHEQIEYLGDNRDARFMRCEHCRAVFILQGGTVWTVPGKDAQNDDRIQPGRATA